MNDSPLPIGEIDSPHFRGRIGVCPCPGKDRPLAEDLQTLQDWQARMVVSFIEDHEFAALGLPSFGRELAQQGVAWRHYPIGDFSVPSADIHDAWERGLHEIKAILEDGANVIFHCRGGLGRSGSMAAWILIHHGHSAQQAIEIVRAARGPGAIETAEQEQFLHDFAVAQAEDD